MGCDHWHANQNVGDAPVFTAERFGPWDDSLVFDAGQQRPYDSAGGGQQLIRRAKGFFDRAMHEFHTPSGQCWHVTPERPTLANSQRIDKPVFVSTLM